MAEVNFRDRLWMIRDHLPGVPELTLYQHYAQTARDYLKRTRAWRYSSPNLLDWNSADAFPDLTVAGVLPTVVAGDIIVVEPDMVKWSDGQYIAFQTREQMDEVDVNWETTTGVKGRFWTITSPGNFFIHPQANANLTAVIRLRTILTINPMTRTSLPEEIMMEHENGFKAGVLAALYAMPGKDWTDLKLALAWGDQYEMLIKSARSRADADYGSPARTVQYGGIEFSDSPRTTRTRRRYDYYY